MQQEADQPERNFWAQERRNQEQRFRAQRPAAPPTQAHSPGAQPAPANGSEVGSLRQRVQDLEGWPCIQILSKAEERYFLRCRVHLAASVEDAQREALAARERLAQVSAQSHQAVLVLSVLITRMIIQVTGVLTHTRNALAAVHGSAGGAGYVDSRLTVATPVMCVHAWQNERRQRQLGRGGPRRCDTLASRDEC